MSEVADNKWEAEAAKPPLVSPAALAQILMMTIFAGFFAYILVMSVVGIVTPKEESDLAKKIGGATQNTEEPATNE